MAAIRKDRITDGPALGTASTIVKKIPVPMVAPTPIMVRENRPIDRVSPPVAWGSAETAACCSTGLVGVNFWTSVWFTGFPCVNAAARVALLLEFVQKN